MKQFFILILLFFLYSCQSIHQLEPNFYEKQVSDYNRYLELSKKYEKFNITTYKPTKHDFLFNINDIIKNIKTTNIHIIKSHSFYVAKYEPNMGGSFISSCYDYNDWYYYCGKPLIFIYGLTGADGVTIYEDLFLEYNNILTYNSILEESFSKTHLEYKNTNKSLENDNYSGEVEIEKKSTKNLGSHSIYSFNLLKNSEEIKEFENLKSSINFRKISKLQEFCPLLPLKYNDYLVCVEETKQKRIEEDEKYREEEEEEENPPTSKRDKRT